MCVNMAPIMITAIVAAPVKVRKCPCPNNRGTTTEMPLISSAAAMSLIMPGLKSAAQVPPLATIFSLL